MTTTLRYTTTLEVHTCGDCHVPFGVPQGFLAERWKDGRNFYCPNGHARVYLKTEADSLRELVAVLENTNRWERDQREAAERSNAALRGVVTRKTKELARVKSGVCPCCNRSFQNLARHMSGQHPDFTP